MINCPKDYLDFSIKEGVIAISKYFVDTPAKNWSASGYFNATVDSNYATRKLKNQILNKFKSDLEKIIYSAEVPSAAKIYASKLKNTTYVKYAIEQITLLFQANKNV